MAQKFLALVGTLVFTVSLACIATQVRSDQVDRGGEWLSWNQPQRATYVDGFIAGYLQGTNTACDVAQNLLGNGKQYRLGEQHHPSEMPSARCLAQAERYTKASYARASGPDFSPYVDVIT